MQITLEPKENDSPNKYILVDGVRWGGTWVTHNGMHGKTYTIGQVNGAGKRCSEISVIDKSYYKGYRTPSVRSFRKKDLRYQNPDKRSTEQRIIDLAKELIDGGHLVSPDVYERKLAESLERCRAAAEKIENEKQRRFRTRACQAAGINADYSEIKNDDQRALVDRVIEAMVWAQSQ